MDVLVMLEERPAPTTVVAHVSSMPAPRGSGEPARDVVTLYRDADAESLALALAAAMEARRDDDGVTGAVRTIGVSPTAGAVGDAHWRDAATGQVMTRDLDIPIGALVDTAQALLSECGQLFRRLLAGLRMPEWPEGTRRAVLMSVHPVLARASSTPGAGDSFLAAFREADGTTFGFEGD